MRLKIILIEKRPIVMMESKGCDKTELARSITYTLSKSRKYIVFYLTHREEITGKVKIY